jgi:peptidoglycan/LPS O-acetylase OafA/YrhL
LSHVLYYFGGMLVIGAMSLFMTLGWELFGPWGSALITSLYLAGALGAAAHLKSKGLAIPAGVLATLAVCLVPLLVWSLQVGLGLWPDGFGLWPVWDGGAYRSYHAQINWRWLTLEFSTLAAAAVMLRAMRLPFMVMPVAVTLWYMSMDLGHLLMQKHGFDWMFTRDVSLVFGLTTCALAVWVDLRCRLATDPEDRQDFAFWLYLFGALMFWGSLSLSNHPTELGKAGYALLNVGLVFLGATINRRVFTVLGAVGVVGYLGDVSSRLFHDSLVFTFVVTLLGLGAVLLGVWWQRHEAVLHARLLRWLPAALQPLGQPLGSAVAAAPLPLPLQPPLMPPATPPVTAPAVADHAAASTVVSGRMPMIDALKALASQMIVLHHLAFYGPMTDWTYELAPWLVTWFSQDARMAVQVFLVVGGFLAVRSLAPHGVLLASRLLPLLRKRYRGIALPYLVALVVAMLCTELARRWMDHDSVPDAPTLWQGVAHVLLLESLLDIDSLSAGVWYVAIDFQLYALLLGVLWLARRVSAVGVRGGVKAATAAGHAPSWRFAWPGLVLVGGLAAGSLFRFNIDPEWDSWATYFFGAYALGVFSFWANQLGGGRWRGVFLVGMASLTVLALLLDFRERIALALAVALLLGVAQGRGWLYRWPRSRLLAWLGEISYSVFLLNFPVALVVNAVFTRFMPENAWVQTAGVLVAWAACVGAGALFHRWVEAPLRRWKPRFWPLKAT